MRPSKARRERWVNQNQTFAQETAGGYLWSPKRNTNGARNPLYEFMREVAPGDLVLSLEGTHIRAIGVARSYAYECPKPPEFGSAGVGRLKHLRASHIRPWRDSDNQARLDGENGLLLTPSIDHLFDRGFISFEDNGRLLISPVANADSLRRLGIQTDTAFNVGGFSKGQRRHLDYHREMVFLEARTS
jgi:hypothetical protein